MAASRFARPDSARVAYFQPARERLAAGQRELAVGRDPVGHAKLSEQPERLARARPVVHGKRARLDPPAPGLQRRQRDALLRGGHGPRMRAGVVHGRIFWTAGGVAGLRQRSRQILDPAARALSFLVRRPSDVVQVDRRESLDRLVHLVGERSRDVLEAAAIRLVIGHGTILAAPPVRQVGVEHAHLIRRAPERVGGRRHAVGPSPAENANSARGERDEGPPVATWLLLSSRRSRRRGRPLGRSVLYELIDEPVEERRSVSTIAFHPHAVPGARSRRRLLAAPRPRSRGQPPRTPATGWVRWRLLSGPKTSTRRTIGEPS